MDRELSESTIRKKKRSLVFRITLFSLLFLLIFFSARRIIKPSVKISEIRTDVVKTGDIEVSITGYGVVVPEFEEVKNSPIQSRIVYINKNAGDKVTSGDTILSLDKKNLESSLIKVGYELDLKKNNADLLFLQLDKNIFELKTQYDIKKLQIEKMENELEIENYLYKIGGGTKEKIGNAELNLKISQLELEQINQSILIEQKSKDAEILNQNLEISIQEKNLNDLVGELKQLTIIADNNGVITWVNDQIGKSVNTGEELVKIANLDSYAVTGNISEIYADKLYVGMEALVRLNGNNNIKGEVVAISPSIINSNTIQFKIKLNNESHPLLRPNLRVDVYVITSQKNGVTLIENGSFYNGGIKQVVFIKQGNELIRKEIELGESNYEFIEVLSGITEGETVVISDMSDYEKYKRVNLK